MLRKTLYGIFFLLIVGGVYDLISDLRPATPLTWNQKVSSFFNPADQFFALLSGVSWVFYIVMVIILWISWKNHKVISLVVAAVLLGIVAATKLP